MLYGKVSDIIKNAVYSKPISQTYITDRPYKLLGNHQEVLFYQNLYQTFSDWWVERNDNFPTSATGLFARSSGEKRQDLRKETYSESLLLRLQVLLLYSCIFPDSKNIQTYKGIIVIITYFLFIGKNIAGGGSGNLQLFSV